MNLSAALLAGPLAAERASWESTRLFSPLQILESGPGCAHQRGHIAFWRAILVHHLMGQRNLIERKGLAETRIDFPIDDKLVECVRLFVIGEMRPLQALLPHPQVAQICHRVVARSSRAD